MEAILVMLIVAILNGSIVYIDKMLSAIVPITLYAEKYMFTVSGTDISVKLFNIIFAFGVSLIVLKFLKKGFETYVLWTEGDADEEPISLITNFIKAMVVAICFPTLYMWLCQVVEELTDKLLFTIGESTDYNWQVWVNGISNMGIVTAIFGLIFIVCYFLLYFQFLMRGLEIFILRIGIPIAAVGLLDNDKGIFKAYVSKFFQSTFAVIIQISLAKLGVGLMLNMHIFWGVACMMLAIRTPKFLSDFLITTGGGGGNFSNRIYQSARLVGMARKILK